MKKVKNPWQKFLIYFSLILFGLLLGYYLMSHYSHKRMSTTPICDALTNITPASGAKITSPLTISVTIDNTKSCRWTVFEAQAGTITLQDKSGILGKTNLTTSENWMTDKPVTYTGTISFTKPSSGNLTLTIQEEKMNEQEGKMIKIPLTY